MRLAERLRPLAARQPWSVLVPLFSLQWLALAVFALRGHHNGWLFSQGADGTYQYTTSWLLSGWHMPATLIGYGWPYLLAPIALFAGPSMLSALPAVVVLQALVLLPAAVLALYGIASRIGGRLAGYWTAGLFVFAPYVLIRFWDPRFRPTYRDVFLPQALGLTGHAEFPSLVCLLVAAYLVVRTLDEPDPRLGALAGLASGFAVALQPANLIFLAAPLAAFLVAHRWRELAACAAAVVPALVTAWIWKHRGGGHSFTHFTDLDVQWSQLGQNLDGLREYFGGVRLLEYLPIAGVLAIARRSGAKAALVGLWFAAFFFIRGASPHAAVTDGSFLQALLPAWPAYLLLVGAIPLLLPSLGTRLAERFPAARGRTWPVRTPVLATAAVVFAVLPFAIVLGLREQRRPIAVSYANEGVLVPVDSSFEVTATKQGDRTRLTWPARGGGSARVAYDVFRAPVQATQLPCKPGPGDCRLDMKLVARVGANELSDRPPKGTWAYRIGVSANYQGRGDLPGLLLLGAPSR